MSDQESSNTDRRETMSVQEAIDRAKNEPGEDLEALQSLVIENGRPIDAALFALAVQSGVNHGSAPDTRDVEERVFRSGDAFAAFELASEVKGVDRVRAQEVILESDDPESCRHALRLAKSDFPGIDRDALKEKVLRSGSGLTLVRLAETFPDVDRDRVARGVLERGGAFDCVELARDVLGYSTPELARKVRDEGRVADCVSYAAEVPGADGGYFEDRVLREAGFGDCFAFYTEAEGVDRDRLRRRMNEIGTFSEKMVLKASRVEDFGDRLKGLARRISTAGADGDDGPSMRA